jgi:hypothetical protein
MGEDRTHFVYQLVRQKVLYKIHSSCMIQLVMNRTAHKPTSVPLVNLPVTIHYALELYKTTTQHFLLTNLIFLIFKIKI